MHPSWTSNLLTLLKGAAIFLPTFILGTVVYRLFLHPLRKFPGPISCRATFFPLYYHQLKGDLVFWIFNLHQQYGPTVRYSPVRLTFADAQSIRDIYGYRSELKYCLPKEPNDYGSGGNSLITYDDDQVHAKRRKVFNNAFSERAVKAQEPLVGGYVNLLIKKMNEAAATSTPLNMVDMYNFTAFDITADLTFGEPLGVLQQGKYTRWVETLFEKIKAVNLIGVLIQFSLLRFLLFRVLPLVMPAEMKKAGEEFDNFGADAVDKRLARKTDRPDIWTFVLNGKEDLSLKEMHTNGQMMMIAGTETTSTLMSGFTYLLLRDPVRLRKLQSELRRKFTTSEEMTLTALAQMHYLNDCIHEALRVYNPVPSGLTRRVPPGGITISGQDVPAGTTVSSHGYTVTHSEWNFKDAMSFIPERWSDTTGEFASDNKTAFQPFSMGPRGCIGQTLAWHEARIIAAKVFWHFDMTLCGDDDGNWLNQRTFLGWDKKPLMVSVTPWDLGGKGK